MFEDILEKLSNPVSLLPKRKPAIGDESAPISIATPAMKLLCAVGDASDYSGPFTAVSSRGKRLIAAGYKCFPFKFQDGYATLLLGETSEEVVELHSLISYPDRRGYGTEILRRICNFADELGVKLWLNAQPYGANREQIPLRKLKELYNRFSFYAVRQIPNPWLNDFHRWEQGRKPRFDNAMIRNPALDCKPSVG